MTKSVFAYKNGVLCAEALPLSELAEDIDSPFFCSSLKQFRRNIRDFKTPFKDIPVGIDYASGAHDTLSVFNIVAHEGAGLDVSCASGIARAIEAQIPMENVSLSGKGKTEADIEAALVAGLGRITAESLADIGKIEKKAQELSLCAPLVLRVSAYQGDEDGLSLSHLARVLDDVLSKPFFAFKGFALSRKEERLSLGLYERRLKYLGYLSRLVEGRGVEVESLGLGAGPVSEDAEMKALYARLTHEEWAESKAHLFFEPGAGLVADARVLIVRVLDVVGDDIFTDAVLDQNLLRAALPVREGLGRNALLPGDLLAVMGAGAMGPSVVSVSGRREDAPEILVSGARSAVVRRRLPSVEQMARECCPDWIGEERVA